MTAHLTKVHDRFTNYFPEKCRDEWICNPCGVDTESFMVLSNKEAHLVELLCDSTRKRTFTEVTLSYSVLVW